MEMDDTFQRHLRLTKPQFHFFFEKLEMIKPQKVDSKKVIMFLWYLTNNNSFRELSDKFDISQGAAHNAFVEMLDTTCEPASTFIIWPSECEKRGNAVVFHRMCGIHGIIGSIDGCHIRIQRPQVRGGDYLNRKSYYSVLLQGIVDDRGRFIDIFGGPPGRVHDSQMLRVSFF